ncbi:hypothetical protein V8C86DRAFT_2647356 [Haematococcus lacustris]
MRRKQRHCCRCWRCFAGEQGGGGGEGQPVGGCRGLGGPRGQRVWCSAGGGRSWLPGSCGGEAEGCGSGCGGLGMAGLSGRQAGQRCLGQALQQGVVAEAQAAQRPGQLLELRAGELRQQRQQVAAQLLQYCQVAVAAASAGIQHRHEAVQPLLLLLLPLHLHLLLAFIFLLFAGRIGSSTLRAPAIPMALPSPMRLFLPQPLALARPLVQPLIPSPPLR